MNAPLVARRCCTSPTADGIKLSLPTDPAPPLTGEIVGPRDRLPLDRSLALHEAGHALARVAIGGVVEHVSLVAAHPHEQGTGTGGGRWRVAVFFAAGPAAEKLARGFLFPDAEPEVRETYRRVRACQFGNCDMCQCMLSSLVPGDVTNETAAITNYRKAETIALAMVTSEPGRRFLRIAAHELLKHGEVQGEFFHKLADEVLPVDFLNTLTLEG